MPISKTNDTIRVRAVATSGGAYVVLICGDPDSPNLTMELSPQDALGLAREIRARAAAAIRLAARPGAF